MWYDAGMDERLIKPISRGWQALRAHKIAYGLFAVVAFFGFFGDLQMIYTTANSIAAYFWGAQWTYEALVNSAGFRILMFFGCIATLYWAGVEALKEERRQGDLTRVATQCALGDAPLMFSKIVQIEHLRAKREIVQGALSHISRRYQHFVSGAKNEALASLVDWWKQDHGRSHPADVRLTAILNEFDDEQTTSTHVSADEEATNLGIADRHREAFLAKYETMIQSRRCYDRVLHLIGQRIYQLQEELWIHGERLSGPL